MGLTLPLIGVLVKCEVTWMSAPVAPIRLGEVRTGRSQPAHISRINRRYSVSLMPSISAKRAKSSSHGMAEIRITKKAREVEV